MVLLQGYKKQHAIHHSGMKVLDNPGLFEKGRLCQKWKGGKLNKSLQKNISIAKRYRANLRLEKKPIGALR